MPEFGAERGGAQLRTHTVESASSFMDCGGKRSATPLSQARASSKAPSRYACRRSPKMPSPEIWCVSRVAPSAAALQVAHLPRNHSGLRFSVSKETRVASIERAGFQKLTRRVNMKRTNIRASMLCLTTIFAATFVSAQPLPVDLAGNVSGVVPSVRLTKLINSDLKSQSGESLGRVQDLIVDPVTGQVQFAILSTGASGSSGVGTSTTSRIGTTPGAIGTTAGGPFVAIPWQLVSSSGQGQYVASVDRTKLQSAPTFSSSAWPTIDAAWIQSVNAHYGLSGTGLGRPGSSSGTRTGTGAGIGNPAAPSSGTGTGSGSGASGSGGAGSGSGGGK